MEICKAALKDAIIASLQNSLEAARTSALAAQQAATHSESKAETKWDTFGLESSYLAGAQAQRVSQLEEALLYFEKMQFDAGKSDSRLFRLYRLQAEDDEQEREQGHEQEQELFYLLTAFGAGIKVSVGSANISVLTPASPLGKKLISCEEGDAFTWTLAAKERNFVVEEID